MVLWVLQENIKHNLNVYLIFSQDVFYVFSLIQFLIHIVYSVLAQFHILQECFLGNGKF